MQSFRPLCLSALLACGAAAETTNEAARDTPDTGEAPGRGTDEAAPLPAPPGPLDPSGPAQGWTNESAPSIAELQLVWQMIADPARPRHIAFMGPSSVANGPYTMFVWSSGVSGASVHAPAKSNVTDPPTDPIDKSGGFDAFGNFHGWLFTPPPASGAGPRPVRTVSWTAGQWVWTQVDLWSSLGSARLFVDHANGKRYGVDDDVLVEFPVAGGTGAITVPIQGVLGSAIGRGRDSSLYFVDFPSRRTLSRCAGGPCATLGTTGLGPQEKIQDVYPSRVDASALLLLSSDEEVLPKRALYRSTDQGQTLVPILTPANGPIRLVIDPQDEKTFGYLAKEGFQETVDGGLTWHTVAAPPVAGDHWEAMVYDAEGTLFGVAANSRRLFSRR